MKDTRYNELRAAVIELLKIKDKIRNGNHYMAVEYRNGSWLIDEAYEDALQRVKALI